MCVSIKRPKTDPELKKVTGEMECYIKTMSRNPYTEYWFYRILSYLLQLLYSIVTRVIINDGFQHFHPIIIIFVFMQITLILLFDLKVLYKYAKKEEETTEKKVSEQFWQNPAI